MIWRDKDASTLWKNASDGVFDQRQYFCQNWRADVSVVIDDTGTEQIEAIKYASYGYPVNIPAGDYNLDGVVDLANDENQAKTWQGGTHRARADLNLDGAIDASDTAIVTANNGLIGGRGVLSRNDTGNRKGYAGYESDATADAGNSRFWHVRHRVLDSTMGRWTRRDPAGYVDGTSLQRYGWPNSLAGTDPDGQNWLPCDTPIPWLGGWKYLCMPDDNLDFHTPESRCFGEITITTTCTPWVIKSRRIGRTIQLPTPNTSCSGHCSVKLLEKTWKERQCTDTFRCTTNNETWSAMRTEQVTISEFEGPEVAGTWKLCGGLSGFRGQCRCCAGNPEFCSPCVSPQRDRLPRQSYSPSYESISASMPYMFLPS